MLPENEQANYETFRDCLSSPIIQRSASKPLKPAKRKLKGRKNAVNPIDHASPNEFEQNNNTDAEDLADFIDYIAHEIFPSLPPDLRALSHRTTQNPSLLAKKYTSPLPPSTLSSILALIPPSATDSLATYALLPDTDPLSLRNLLQPVLSDYISTCSAPPPQHNPSVRASACEICDRDWIPLTYHHLIPRSMHAKALKRGWHDEWRLNSVAWLCRACHSFVHGVAGNEELAREWWSVELLLGREDGGAWRGWVGRVRWGKR